jgi:hypothetical protein
MLVKDHYSYDKKVLIVYYTCEHLQSKLELSPIQFIYKYTEGV